MGGPEYSFVSSPKSLHLIQTLYFILDLRHVLAGLLQSSESYKPDVNSAICQFPSLDVGQSFFLILSRDLLCWLKKVGCDIRMITVA